MECKDAIFTRRSVRKFTDNPISDEEIIELLEAARIAPSWANTQTWEFIVVRDKSIIEKVAECYSEINPARKCTLASSALIVGCAKTGDAGYYDGKPTTKFDSWHMFDLGLAVQNISLRAHEMGIGSVIVGLIDHNKLNEVLAVPDGHEAIVVLPLGRPATAAKKAPPRKEISEFVFLDKFNNPY